MTISQNTTTSQIILPDTSLCAIVRDEIMNPAGGIVDFVDSTLPYVESGVIVDTGSKDGTREALEELKLKYSHLEVYDLEFQGFAHARNESLKHCKTKRALVLDADERLTRADFEYVREKILSPENVLVGIYNFGFLNVYQDKTSDSREGLNPRLFNVDGLNFEELVWEVAKYTAIGRQYNIHRLETKIKHFCPSQELLKMKDHFYKQFDDLKENMIDSCFLDILSTIPAFKNWWLKRNIKPLRDFSVFQDLRKYNPKREEYR